MSEHPQVILARTIAQDSHALQLDKAGRPYIEHPAWVAAQVEHLGWQCEAAAWLHDVLEDTALTMQDLVGADVDLEVALAVAVLTKHRGMKYAQYLMRCKDNHIARPVKIADVRHNRDEDRLALLDEATAERLRRKYDVALEALA